MKLSKYTKKQLYLMIVCLITFLLPENSYAHIKWFVAFDLADPPKPITDWIKAIYPVSLFLLSIWGVLFACIMDSFWCKHYGRFSYLSNLFSDYDDVTLNIARIGTGVFFVGLWLMGGTIFTPELITSAWFIPYIQLLIAITVLFKRTLIIAGLGILFLYGYALSLYGLFHLLDYVTMVGLGLYLILSINKHYPLARYRLPILYAAVVFAFLWSSIEKLAYPQWFYPFLDKYPFLTMGLDKDLFIASAAFVEFTLFFLLLMGSNGVILIAFLANLLITSGNIYFGKIDAIGHFPVNFILLMMVIKGPLPIKTWFFNHSCKPYSAAPAVAMTFFITIALMVAFYYGLHWLLYNSG